MNQFCVPREEAEQKPVVAVGGDGPSIASYQQSTVIKKGGEGARGGKGSRAPL